MPRIVPLEDAEEFDPNEFEFDSGFLFKITTPEMTDEVDSPDEVCDMICDLLADQFWDWWLEASRSRRFKPRIKVYEVLL